MVHEKDGNWLALINMENIFVLIFFFFKAASAAILLCPAVFVSSQYWLALGLSSVFCFIFKDISEDIKCNVEAADFRDCMCIVH